MERLDHDPNVFWFKLPVWLVVSTADAEDDRDWVGLADPGVRVPVACDAEGAKCLPVFTDQSRGEEFATRLQLENPLQLSVATPARLLQLLDEAESLGVERILFDPRGGTDRGIQSHRIAKIRDEIRGSGRA